MSTSTNTEESNEEDNKADLQFNEYVKYETVIEGITFRGTGTVRQCYLHDVLIRVQISERVGWLKFDKGQEIRIPYEDLTRTNKPETEPCETCKGLGFEPCDKCQGHGQVPSNGIHSAPMTCPKCKGTKVGPAKCIRCDGLKGFIFVPA